MSHRAPARSFLLCLWAALATLLVPLPGLAAAPAPPSGDGPASAARRPFGGHRVRYAPGTILPAGRPADLTATAGRLYDQWKARYLKTGCSPDRFYVSTDARGGGMSARSITVSEAHGYGMLIAAFIAGHDPEARRIFDGLYRFFRDHPSRQSPDLMAWNQLEGCVTDPKNGDNTATDGDLDIAYALLLADRQWGSAGAVDYLAQARRVIAAIAAHELNPRTHLTVLGSWVSPGEPKWAHATRTSDFMMSHFRAYRAATGDSRWDKVLDAHFSLVAAMQARFAPGTGLLPDFVVDAPAAPRPAPPDFLEGSRDGVWGSNACRVPLRLGIDFLLHADPRARAALTPINAWIRRKTGDDPRRIDDGYRLDGANFTPEVRNRMSSIAPLGVAAMIDGGNRRWLDRIWKLMVTRPVAEENYYGNTLRVLAMIAMSGNWWSP